MATKQIKKLSDLQKITTATGDQMIPVVDASGNVNPIKLTDLAQVVAELMPIYYYGKYHLSNYNKIILYGNNYIIDVYATANGNISVATIFVAKNRNVIVKQMGTGWACISLRKKYNEINNTQELYIQNASTIIYMGIRKGFSLDTKIEVLKLSNEQDIPEDAVNVNINVL